MLIFINGNRSVGTINKNIYGHFAEHLGRCIYGGLYVGEDSEIPNQNGMRTDVVNALKALDIPVIRWPGGCFADTYHWRDGIGPKSSRKTLINTTWGGVREDNSFGTHEFMELCRQLGCEAYINGNVGTGTVQEMCDWVEYCNMPGVSPMADLRRQNGQDAPWNVKYWGIGNEMWGGGGNMRADYYSDLCRQYASFLRDYDPSHKIYKIASGACDFNYDWTQRVAELTGALVDALSLHYYTIPGSEWEHKGSATKFSREEYYITMYKALQMKGLIENHTARMRQACPNKNLGLVIDEWGTWLDVEEGTNPHFLYQQNAMRDALVAAVNLNIFGDHCDSVVMANIAQTVNVLQAMILTDGPRMLCTPTYHVFHMFKGHQGARQLETYAQTALIGADGADCKVPNLHVSASEDHNGNVLVTVVNLSDHSSVPVEIHWDGLSKFTSITGQVLSGDGAGAAACNTFDTPHQVEPKPLTNITVGTNSFTSLLPACSVAAFTLKA